MDEYRPKLPLTRGETIASLVLATLFVGMFVADLFRRGVEGPVDYRFSPFLILAATVPLLVVHEMGHAVMARLCGWSVPEVVIGFGRELFRFQVAGSLVRVRMAPVEGYIVPAPQNLHGVRYKSALVYLAGPGAEAAVLGGVYAKIGGRLFAQADTFTTMAAQCLSAAIVISLFVNLVPMTRGPEVNDGMGVVLSWFLPPAAYAPRIGAPYVEGAMRAFYREKPEEGIRVLDEGLSRQPQSRGLKALKGLGHELVTHGEPASDRDAGAAPQMPPPQFEHSGPIDIRPETADAGSALAEAWGLLFSAIRQNRDDLLLFGRRSAELAKQRGGGVHADLALGYLEYHAGAPKLSFAHFMDAYKEANSPEAEAQALAGLVLASRLFLGGSRLGAAEPPVIQPGYPQRFENALKGLPLGPRVRRALETRRP